MKLIVLALCRPLVVLALCRSMVINFNVGVVCRPLLQYRNVLALCRLLLTVFLEHLGGRRLRRR